MPTPEHVPQRPEWTRPPARGRGARGAAVTGPTRMLDAPGGPLRRSILSAAAAIVHQACCLDHAVDALVALGADNPRPEGWKREFPVRDQDVTDAQG